MPLCRSAPITATPNTPAIWATSPRPLSTTWTPLLFVIFQQAFAISLEKITLLVTGNFCLQLLVDLIAARFVDKIGYRPCVVAAHLFAAAGLIGMGTFPRLFPDPYAGLMLAVGCTPLGAASSRCSSAPL